MIGQMYGTGPKLLLAVIIVGVLMVAYSYLTTGDMLSGIYLFINTTLQNPLLTGFILLIGFVVGYLMGRQY